MKWIKYRTNKIVFKMLFTIERFTDEKYLTHLSKMQRINEQTNNIKYTSLSVLLKVKNLHLIYQISFISKIFQN